MTVVDALFLVGAFVVAVLYRKLVEREIMYKDYYQLAYSNFRLHGIDPMNNFLRMKDDYGTDFHEKLAKEAIQDAFVHHFRTLGVKIENVTIYWND